MQLKLTKVPNGWAVVDEGGKILAEFSSSGLAQKHMNKMGRPKAVVPAPSKDSPDEEVKRRGRPHIISKR